MNLDDFIITCFCLIDEMMPMILKDQRLRAKGPAPKLTDSEVITMEVVGSYLGLSQDKKLFAYFQQHYTHFFPALRSLHRTTFVRQAANLWVIKERLWCWLRDEVISYDPCMSIVDSVPVPVCRFARAPWCVRLRGRAGYGKDHADRQTFSGFRLHAQVSWPGLLTRVFAGSPQRIGWRNCARVVGRSNRGRIGGPQLLASRSASVFANERHCAASSIPPSALAQSRRVPKFCFGTRALPHRHSVWAIDGSLSDETSVGAGYVASAYPLVAILFDAYHVLFLQSARRGSVSTI